MKYEGSFRGVRFFTERSSVKPGQRHAIYEIPFDDRGAVSIPMGRRARRFRISALLISPDPVALDAQLTAMLKAVEQPGPGLLVHPRLGSVMVVPEDDGIDIDESTTGLGLIEVRFSVVESRAAAAPAAATTAPRASMPSRVSAVKLASAEAFERDFSLDDVADFVRDANIAELTTALANLRTLNGTLSAVLSVPGQLAAEIDLISQNIATLVDTPRRLYDTIEGTLDKVFQAIGRVAGRFGVDVEPDGPAARPDVASLSMRALTVATLYDPMQGAAPPGQRDTPDRIRERQNSAAIRNAMRAATLAAIADASLTAVLPSRQDARTIRDALLAMADRLALDVSLDPTVFEALEDLRAAVRRTITGDDLGELTTYTPGDEMPAVVIAWQLYGDAERAEEIVQRNDITDPGAVPGRVALEVFAE